MIQQIDTIFALSSGAGKAGVSVFRVSGPETISLVRTMSSGEIPKARHAALRRFKGPRGGIIDEGLLIFFEGPQSFTGEDCAEFHTHGSPAIVKAMGRAFSLAGLRQAKAGEFTRRAFSNGKLDLTEAEGLADLIDSETEGQRRQALRQMQGGLKDLYEGWRVNLIDALAAIEGDIDFPDEHDVPDALANIAMKPLDETIASMDKALSQAVRGERVRSGVEIVIIGPPNAGKSTLLNYLSGRETAIVSDEAGTTRDVIDVHMEIEGLPVRISDTAGLRFTENKVEAEGVRRALTRSDQADLRIGVISPETLLGASDIMEQLRPGDILIKNKMDIGSVDLESSDVTVLSASAVTGLGMDDLNNELAALVKARFSLTENAGLTRSRHKTLTLKAIESLRRAKESLLIAPELAGDDVRSALHSIKELAGETDIEAVLGAIFSRFCIGK